MLTQQQILSHLSKDTWFRTSSSLDKVIINDENGNKVEVAKSYYHFFGFGKIVIRVSDHGTYLDTLVKSRNNPSKSLQNLSVVFSNGPLTFKTITEPKEIVKDGIKKYVYTYFVVE